MSLSTPTEKINTLFDMLTRRFGEYQLKDGQVLASIKTTWSLSVGRYRMKSLTAAAGEWATRAKFNNWPSEAEFMAILREMGSEPEHQTDARNAVWVNAQNVFANFHRQLMDDPRIDNEIVGHVALQAVLNEVVRAEAPGSRGKSFQQLGTEAVLRGDLPAHWNAIANAVLARHRKAVSGYFEHRAMHGAYSANTRYLAG